LAQLADLADGTKARTLVRGLNRFYDREGCAFRVVQVAGGYQLMTRPQFAPWLRRLHRSPVEVRLSAPALETLAVVAYRQPVLRVTIEAIRGVQCGEILRQLMERDLVRIAGRSEELGRPFLYGTARRFLQVFGLRNLEELPRHEWFDLPEATRADGLDESVPSHDNDDIQPNIPDPHIAASSPNRYKDGSDRDPAIELSDPETRASSPNRPQDGSD
jgi:segregation and condensation protein B